MATYKVPQDVEADDKLLGPFTFRQFVYLMIVFGLLMLTIFLFRVFPLLIIIPIPFMIFFTILALPIKKDQPMETYLAALISFYTKPNKRYWVPGQSESTILITTPKKVEASRTRDITEDEASHRLSFLAEIVDSEGHAIKNASTPMKDEFYAEAYNTTDMFDQNNTYGLNTMMTEQREEQRAAVINQMRNAIAKSDYNYQSNAEAPIQLPGQKVLQPRAGFSTTPTSLSGLESPAIVQPTTPIVTPQPAEDVQAAADRIRKENESEVYVSLR